MRNMFLGPKAHCPMVLIQLISAAFEHPVLRVQEIYDWENAVFDIVVYGSYEP